MTSDVHFKASLNILHILQDEGHEAFDLEKIRNNDTANMKLNPEVDCMLVGFDGNFSYTKMLLSASYARKSTHFIGTNSDECFLTNDLVVPG